MHSLTMIATKPEETLQRWKVHDALRVDGRGRHAAVAGSGGSKPSLEPAVIEPEAMANE